MAREHNAVTTKHQEKRLLTIQDASVYLSMSVYSMRSLIWAGSLPYIQRKKLGKILIDRNDLDAFIETEKKPARREVSL